MKLGLIFPGFNQYSRLDTTWVLHGIGHLYTECKQAGIDVEFIDGRLMDFKTTTEKISSGNFTHIGISVISAYKDNAEKLIRWIKANEASINIIVGGVHPSVCPDWIGNTLADFVVIGEGEKLLLKIMKNDLNPGVYQGIVDDLDSLKPIDRSIFPYEEELIGGNLPKPFHTIIIGRACPSQCTFCAPVAHNMFGKKMKLRSSAHVINELKLLNGNSFYINDDCFIAYPNYVREFCKAIKPLDLKWWCQGRADIVSNNESMIEEMTNSGLCGMIIGHESGNDEVLSKIKKGVTRAENIKSAHVLQDNGCQVWSNIMLGFPNELPHQVIDTISMVSEMKPNVISICGFTPTPGSFLYNECQRKKIMPLNPDQEYFNRGGISPKIVGPDYKFLDWACNQMMQITYGRKN